MTDLPQGNELPGVFLALRCRGAASNLRKNKMRELTNIEMEQVDGGILAYIAAAWAAYQVIDFAYSVGSAFADGYKSTSNFQ